MGVDQNKMKAPNAPVLLGLLIIVLLSSAPASRAQRAFLSKYIWRSKLQRPYMQIFREVHQAPPTRFQRGVDPADESREVDMRMIFDELKKDLKAAMDKEKEESEMRTVWPEIEEDGSEQPVSYYQKYRL